jgi:hypothetical protein
LAIAAVLLFASGCASDPEPARPSGPKASNRKPPPPVAGQETYFDGKVLAELNVGAGQLGAPGGKPGDGAAENGHGGAPGGGHHMRGGGGGGGGGYGGHHSGGQGEGGGPPAAQGGDPEDAQIMVARRAAASGHAPVMIHLRLTNQGSERLDVYVPDFLSPLGNFVIEPAKLTLDPGQALEVEPMTSRLVDDIDGTTVTLTLHIAGHTEKKVITLQAAAPPSNVAPEPAPSPAGNRATQ